MHAMNPGNTGDLVRRPGAACRLLKGARTKAQLTQRELAERAGVPQATVGRIESGASQPKLETLLLLLNAAGFELELRPRRGEGIDRTLIRQQLELSFEERVRRNSAESANVDRLLSRLKR